MLNMTKHSKVFLKKNYPELLSDNDLDRVLLALDAFITQKGLDINDDMTDFGYEAQAVYDDIYESND